MTLPLDTGLVDFAKRKATAAGLDPILICAICEQESQWNFWLNRYEPGFEAKYHDVIVNQAAEFVKKAPFEVSWDTEVKNRCMSWGLLQLMGQPARELGFTWPLASLCEPGIGLEWSCKELAAKLKLAGGNVERALQLWNGGADPEYAAKVLAREGNYR